MINLQFTFPSSGQYKYCKVNIYWKTKKVGYCYLSIGEGYVWVDILNITPSLQGKGYGRKFIEFLTATYKVRGEHTVTSIGFYEKLGAKIKGNEFYFNKPIGLGHKN